jgi:hypothetical protein
MLERTDAPSYGYILAQGATSLTEGWDGGHSQDHFMLGSAEEWFYRGLGGINVDLSRESAQRLVLHPVVEGNIAWARVHYQSALGEIESEWHRGPAQTVYNFTVPANAAATIQIDSTAAGMVTVNGAPPAHAAGVLETHIDGAHLEMTVSAGKYEVRAANPSR